MERTSKAENPEGIVLEIQRMSTEDGPGIRTTVFLKGCTLQCLWCHNPESISIRPQLQWVESRCIGCRTCEDVCPQGALLHQAHGIEIDRERCQGCGTCAEACPSTALELMGAWWDAQALADELAKDKAYFDKSGGGITISGGEATMQPDFTAALLEACRDRGLQTAVDTCGYTARENLERILPLVDLLLFDVKEIDPEKHREFTGHSNRRILEHLEYVRDYMKFHPRPEQLWIRTPMIPGTTATEENIRGIGRFLAEHMRGAVDRWELCAFNNLCRDKYLRLGRTWRFMDTPLMSQAEMERLWETARQSGVDPEIVFWSGATRLEESDSPEEPKRPDLRLVTSCD